MALYDDPEGWGDGSWKAQEGGDICISMTDSHHCTIEINTL